MRNGHVLVGLTNVTTYEVFTCETTLLWWGCTCAKKGGGKPKERVFSRVYRIGWDLSRNFTRMIGVVKWIESTFLRVHVRETRSDVSKGFDRFLSLNSQR